MSDLSTEKLVTTMVKAVKARVVPKKAPDFFSLYAQEIWGMPSGWRWTQLRAKAGGDGKLYSLMNGGKILGEVFKSGRRKGQINYKKRDPAWDREFILDHDELHKFIRAWELKTGTCSSCGGSGQFCTGWSITEGNHYRTCERCGGDGKAKP